MVGQALVQSRPSTGYPDPYNAFVSEIWGDLMPHGLSYHDKRHPNSGHLWNERANPTKDTGKCKGTHTLARIKLMPLEMIYEILVHVEPVDLLNISVANHWLRDILLSKRSRFIWKTSLASVRGLPPCPPDMTELQFSRLIFRETCHFCNEDGIKDVFWMCSVRCCQNCITKEFISEAELSSRIPHTIIIEKLKSVFPFITIHKYEQKQPFTTIYYHPIAVKYIAELEEVLVTSPGSSGVDAWLKLMQRNQTDRLRHSLLCEHWHNRWVVRTFPKNCDIPVFDLVVTAVLSTALVYLWRDKIFG